MKMTMLELGRGLAELDAFLTVWGKATNTIDDTFVWGNNSPFVDAYIRLMSLSADDTEEWISWYIWENDFGRHALKAGHGDEMHQIRAVSDLWRLIEASRSAQ